MDYTKLCKLRQIEVCEYGKLGGRPKKEEGTGSDEKPLPKSLSAFYMTILILFLVNRCSMSDNHCF